MGSARTYLLLLLDLRQRAPMFGLSGLIPHVHAFERLRYELGRTVGLVGKPLDPASLLIPLVHLLLLVPIRGESAPNEAKHSRPRQLDHLGILRRQLFVGLPSDRDETNAEPEVAPVNAVPVNVQGSFVDALLGNAADGGEHAVDVPL